MDALYTAVATVHGRDARVVSTSGRIDLPLAAPVALGGNGQGTNPEEILAAGYAACFTAALGFIAGQESVDVTDVSVTAEIGIGKESNGGFGLTATIRVELPEHLQGETGTDLIVRTHAFCPYSKALHNNVPIKIVIN